MASVSACVCLYLFAFAYDVCWFFPPFLQLFAYICLLLHLFLLVFACFCVCVCLCLLAFAFVLATVSCFCLHFGVDVAGPGFALLVVVAFACGLSVVGVAGVINDVGWLLLPSFESIICWKSTSKIRSILPLLLLCLHL